MKHPIMKCARWYLQWQVRLVCLTAAILFFVLSAHAQTDATLPPVGGPGGNAFVARCPQGRFLTGFELRTGDTVDAIRPICVAAYGPNEIGPLQSYPSKFGGDGGGIQQLVCPSDAPIVIKMDIGWAGKEIFSVSYIGLFCGVAGVTQTPSKFPTVKFYEPFQDSSRDIFGVPHSMVKRGAEMESCPPGLVAVGINGRAGKWLDAVGLICGVPKLTPKPIALGRVQPTSPSGPPMSICARARAARARNSPAAPALEAQCRAAGAAGEKTPPGPVALGRVGPTSPPGPPMSICARARAARARNSPTAPALEAQCRAAGAAGETLPPAAPTITADPNPVMVPNGQASGTTIITWKAAPDYTYCEIYLSVDNGEWSEFASGGDSAKSTTITLGSSYTFRMMVYEGQAGTPKIITTLTVTAPKN
jgi:hypothetical protein